MNSPANVRLHYLYRDASNYKAYGTVVFLGSTADAAGTSDDTMRFARLLATLPSDSAGASLFVPDQVGLPNLRHELPGYYDDDTNWHELVSIEPTNDRLTVEVTFGEFIGACETVTRWDPEIHTEDL